MDDPAAFSMGTNLTSQIRGTRQAIQNLNSAKGLLNTADAGIASQISILQQMRDLALQAANGLLDSTQRSQLNKIFQGLREDLNQIALDTTFGDLHLLDRSLSKLTVQSGAGSDDHFDIELTGTRERDLFDFYIPTEASGTFSLASTLSMASPTPADPVGDPVVADLNNDNKLDMILTMTSPGGANNRKDIYLGNGDGTFYLASTVAAHSSSHHSPTLGDFTDDGILDMVITDTAFDQFLIYQGNGDGTFAFKQTLGAGNQYTGANEIKAYLVDENGDDYLDLAFSVGNTIFSYLAVGDGTFGAVITSPSTIGTNGASPIFADVNGDSIADALINSGPGSLLVVHFGDGDGTYTVSSTLVWGGTGFDKRTVLEDLDNDGDLDIVGMAPDYLYSNVLLNDGAGNYSVSDTITIPAGTEEVGVADINEDGYQDLVYSHPGNDYVLIALSNGAGSYAAVTTMNTVDSPLKPLLKDFNADGNIDMLVASNTALTIAIYLGNGTGEFTYSESMSTNVSGATQIGDTHFARRNGGLFTADFNNDNINDIYYKVYDNTDGNPSEVQIRLGNAIFEEIPASMDISTQTGAQALLDYLDGALDTLIGAQAKIAAQSSRLDFAVANNSGLLEAFESAESNMMDTDYAEEIAELVRNQILQQAQIAVLAQANLKAQLVMQLLR